jgi:excisionase family DNA binding protein
VSITPRKKIQQAVLAVPVVNPEPLLLDIHGAARALSATPWAVRSLLWDKKIPFVKIGRRFLVRPADLNAYIENQLGEGAA